MSRQPRPMGDTRSPDERWIDKIRELLRLRERLHEQHASLVKAQGVASVMVLTRAETVEDLFFDLVRLGADSPELEKRVKDLRQAQRYLDSARQYQQELQREAGISSEALVTLRKLILETPRPGEKPLAEEAREQRVTAEAAHAQSS